ncbi:hypothetical protein HDV06_005849 [Boothiomyces sp. JEL0866]|nr:hypothetical protein HDV06_005849 [Boothiomyces sp. JEL0866]
MTFEKGDVKGYHVYTDIDDHIEPQGCIDWWVGPPVLRKRYCGRRMTGCQFYCLNICSLLAIIFTTAFLVIYLIVIPNAIQTQIGSGSVDAATINTLNFTDATNTSTGFYVDMVIKKPSFIPGHVILTGPTEFHLGDPDNFGDGCAIVLINDTITVSTFEDTPLGIPGNITITDMQTMQNILAGKTNYKLGISTSWTITYWGIRWYKNLKLHSVYNMSPDSPSFEFSNNANPFPKAIRADNLNQAIRKDYNISQLITLGPGLPDLYLDELVLDTYDGTKLVFNTTASFENPMKTQMNLTFMEVSLGAQLALMTVRLEKQGGVNWELAYPFGFIFRKSVMTVPLTVTLSFLQPQQDFMSSLTVLGNAFQADNSTLFGPFNIIPRSKGYIFGSISQKMQISLPKGSILTALEQFKKILAQALATQAQKNKQERIIFSPFNKNYIVTAGAGSGKTFTMLKRVEWMVENKIPDETIMITTFTHQAGEEIKYRLQDMLGDHKIRVGTFDSISQSAVRAKFGNTNLHVGEYSSKFLNLLKSESVTQQFKYIFVDEFQDINDLQFQIIKHDPAQNIYQFRGSNPKYMQKFCQIFDNSEHLALTTNYRSTGALVKYSNAARPFLYPDCKMTASNIHGEYIPSVMFFDSMEQQNQAVVNYIRELLQEGTPLEEIAILCPVNFPLYLMEETLEKNGIKNVMLERFDIYQSKRLEGHVCLSTIHRSKGLEWDVVIMIEMSDDIIPKSTESSSIEEAKRLFYVGITRAKKNLNICFSSKKAPSRFITEISPVLFDKNYDATDNIKPSTNVRPKYIRTSLDRILQSIAVGEYEQLRQNGILPESSIITTTNLFRPTIYDSIVHKEHLFEDLAKFIECFIIRSISRVYNLQESKYDQIALQLQSVSPISRTACDLYYKKMNEISTLIEKNYSQLQGKTSKQVYELLMEHYLKESISLNKAQLRSASVIIHSIIDKSCKYQIPWKNIQVMDNKLKSTPESSFLERLGESIKTYGDYSIPTTRAIGAIWDISTCHSIVLKQRNRMLYKKIAGSQMYEAHKKLFVGLTEVFLKQIINNNQDLHEPVAQLVQCNIPVRLSKASHITGMAHIRKNDTLIQICCSSRNTIPPEVILELLAYKSALDGINNLAVLNPITAAVPQVGASTEFAVNFSYLPMDLDTAEDHVLDTVQSILDVKDRVVDASTKAIELAQKCNNPMVQHTITIVESVLKIGNHIPYISPICNILTFIVQVEMKAREAERKCTDLVERINFMVGHLTVLDKVPLVSATESVLEKMNQVLKDSATLIQTYRKQSKIARRLNLGNKDKFDSCFSSIEKCSSDLMFSLQIHQTQKLDELSHRKDDELDLEAERFIKEHGGIANIKNNEELVKQFAAQTKLPVDDSVMQELNTSISNLLIENQSAIENILKENLSSEISKGFEEFAKLMVQADVEEQLNCVQCGQKYRESKNPVGACTFHLSFYDNSCCGSDIACQRKKHRSSHHNDYPYSNYFDMVYKVDIDFYINISDEGLEEELESQECCVGKLLRWTRFTSDVSTDILVVRVGKILDKGPNYFNTYTTSALSIISSCYALDRVKLIHRNYQSGEEYSYAEWVFDDLNNVIGVYCAVKSKTSSVPTAEKVIFDPKTFKMISHERISTQFHNYQPEGDYILPATISIGKPLPQGQSRKERKFKTFGELQPHVHFSTIGDITANGAIAREGHDIYQGKLSMFNKTKDTLVIMGMECSYRLVGDKEYSNVQELEFSMNFPCAIEPLKSVELEFSVTIERDPNDVNYKSVVWNTDYLTRERPLRIKFTATDMEDREGHYVVEYIHFFNFKKTKENSPYEQLWIEDYERIKSYSTTPEFRNNSLDLGKITVDITGLDRKVYKALKNAVTEYEFPSFSGDYFDTRYYGLIDSNCKRMYAIKVLMTEKMRKAGVESYVRIPLYGENKEKKAIKYANEKTHLPEIKVPDYPVYPDDDDVDDIAIQKHIPSVLEKMDISGTPATVSAVQDTSNLTNRLIETLNAVLAQQDTNSNHGTSVKILEKLDAIETHLSRTADSMSQLVGIFSKLSIDRDNEKERQNMVLSVKDGLPSMSPSAEFAPRDVPEEERLSLCF